MPITASYSLLLCSPFLTVTPSSKTLHPPAFFIGGKEIYNRLGFGATPGSMHRFKELGGDGDVSARMEVEREIKQQQSRSGDGK